MLGKNTFVKGQSLAEVVTFLGIVALAIVAMQTYIQRGIQGKTRYLTNAIINPEHLKQRYTAADSATSSSSTKLSGTTKVSTVKGGRVTRNINETTTSTYRSKETNKP